MNAKAATAKSSVRRAARVEDEPRYVVGVDAHSKVLAISVWDWTDRLNPSPCQDFKSVNLEAMARTYRRHVDPDSITIIEASTNSAAIKRELNELEFRAEIVRERIYAELKEKCNVFSRRYFYPVLTDFAPYAAAKGTCPVAEDAAARVLTLPTYYGLPLDDVRDIARNVLEIV